METVTSFRISAVRRGIMDANTQVMKPVEVAPVEPEEALNEPQLSDTIAESSDQDFVMELAYLALEHQASQCVTEIAKQQVGYLLDRLCSLDLREA